MLSCAGRGEVKEAAVERSHGEVKGTYPETRSTVMSLTPMVTWTWRGAANVEVKREMHIPVWRVHIVSTVFLPTLCSAPI
jgi:hypothetical protein